MAVEVLFWLRPQPRGVYLDCTVGYCGHAVKILEASGPTGFLVGIDRDAKAVEYGRKRLERFGQRTLLITGHFVELNRALADRGVHQVNGVLFDLGVSSPQIDDAARGFSFQGDGPLDMRMDQSSGRTAADIVNESEDLSLWRRAILTPHCKGYRSRPDDRADHDNSSARVCD